MEKSALVYIVLTLVTVGFGFCVRNSAYTAGYLSGRRMSGAPVGYDRQQARNLVAETAVFCLLAGVSACRIAVGGDYWVYWLKFQLIDQGRHVSYEKGFVGLVKLFHWIFGEGSYLPIFGFFSLVTVFFFLKALHDQADWYVVSLFLLLTQGFYFNSMNSVRYYFALALAMYAQKYVLRGEYGKFILWVLLGCTIHKSVLLILSLIFGQSFYRNLIFKFYPYYKDSMFDNGQLSYVNIGKCLAVLILCLIYWKDSIRDDRRNRYYFYLNLAGLVLYTCGSFIPEVSRVAYYLIQSQIFLIPGVLRNAKKGWFRNLCIVGVIAAYLLYFVMLLRGMYDVEIRLLPYLNWIFN